MIRFSNVYKAYPNGGIALKDVTFHVSKGEFVFLTGHSGAGKSTIMKVLFAEQRPSGGEVRVSGYNVTTLRPDDVPRLRRRLGDLVGIGEAGLGLVSTKVAEEREQTGVVDRDLRQERAQLLLVATGHRADRVEGREDERLLLG